MNQLADSAYPPVSQVIDIIRRIGANIDHHYMPDYLYDIFPG